MKRSDVRQFALDQTKAPIHNALLDYRRRRIVSFDVPGHKQGRGNEELAAFLGEQCLSVDVNSMKMLDTLIHPTGVIMEAEKLAADAFGADSCRFMVNGTTSAVQAMILSNCSPGDKIIMPRNVHRSAINALILARAVPIYVNPSVDKELGIPLAMSVKDVEVAIREHPDAVAVFVNNPTYYGVCPNLNEVVRIAHAAEMRVLVDEAHGTHFYFQDALPVSAMDAGADMSSVSLHKTGGSLTQSSLLLLGPSMRKDGGYVHQIINLTQTTSASYLLLSSLDITRRNLALRGQKIYERVIEFANYARDEINQIGGYNAFGKERCDGDAFFAFDSCKLPLHTIKMGLSGIEIYDILRDEYDIQIEFGDMLNCLAILSVGDRPVAIERLIAALADIRFTYGKEPARHLVNEYIPPVVVMTPAEAFYAPSEQLPLAKCEGRIASESIMCYPPGIPILAPGERVTAEVLTYIRFAKEKGSRMTGTEDSAVEKLYVLTEK
ncbi:MAG TPA: aminotransferase class I/II-fold pyridoxal phosphate-dependent enzyme [Bacillota bacterium]|nr:aminotransferase class I/II-fold pyridoxal phosphate-dependent enzyme [Bacillota bacterium]HQC48066.1 aminotransferase class I/II-fold pyridoxal phosphate-dependent enzyme [Bacillota bacterium]